MGQVVSAGINAAANASMNAATNETNLQINRETNQTNKELAQQQNQWNIEQWNRENAYNDPARQVERLKGAGLSAAAAAQSIEGAGNASSLQSADLANQQVGTPMVAPQIDLSGMNLISAARQFQALRKEKVDADTASLTQASNIQGILTENDAKRWATAKAAQDYQFAAESNPYKLESIKYHMQSDSVLPALSRMSLKMQKQNFKLAKQQYGFLEKVQPKELEKIGEEIKHIIAQTLKERSEKHLSDVQSQNVIQDTSNKQKLGEGLDLDNQSKIVANTLQKFGMPESIVSRLSALVSDGKIAPSEVDKYLSTLRVYINSGGRDFNGNEQLRDVFIHELVPAIGENDVKAYGKSSFIPQLLRKYQIGDNRYK